MYIDFMLVVIRRLIRTSFLISGSDIIIRRSANSAAQKILLPRGPIFVSYEAGLAVHKDLPFDPGIPSCIRIGWQKKPPPPLDLN